MVILNKLVVIVVVVSVVEFLDCSLKCQREITIVPAAEKRHSGALPAFSSHNIM